MEKVPYMCVIGEKEVQEQTVSVRDRSQGDLGSRNIDEFIAHIQELSESRKG